MSHCLRAANKFPIVIYGDAETPITIKLDHDAVMNVQARAGFYNGILAIVVDDREVEVKAQAVQHHPFKPKLPHVDFIRVQSPGS